MSSPCSSGSYSRDPRDNERNASRLNPGEAHALSGLPVRTFALSLGAAVSFSEHLNAA